MTDPSSQPRQQLAVVAEAFLDLPLPELLQGLSGTAPQVTGLELGSGGYAPHPHCDRELLLADDGARAGWLDQIETAGFSVVALNAWGNPLHPDPGIAMPHDRALRETIQLAARLGVDRVVAMAGCPAAAPGDTTPHFAAGGWLPYLEGVYERQWEESVAPYWSALSAFARAEHPDVQVCLELHPGTSVYNVETFGRLAELGANLAANIDPSHFFWMHMDALAVVAELGARVGHVHAKDVWFNERVLATAGLLDHRWPGPTAEVPWKFATVGHGHDAGWWSDFMAAIQVTDAMAVAIEHEDPDVPAAEGVAEAARLLAGALELAA